MFNTQIYTSPSSYDLEERYSDIREEFLDQATYEVTAQRSQPRLPFIGQGNTARVVALKPGELYIKTSGPWSGRETYHYGGPTRKPNLVHEMHFMEAARQKTANRDEGIYIPRTYFACKFPFLGASSMLQEALPEDATSIERLDIDDPEHYKHISAKLYKRIRRALGPSVMRFCASDVANSPNGVHRGNILMNPELDPDGKIYLIDLLGKRLFRQGISRLVTATTI